MSQLASTSELSGAVYTDQPLFRLTLDQYHDMIERGQLSEDDPVELLDGLMVFRMPKYPSHVTTVELLRACLAAQLSPEFSYRGEQPISLPDQHSEPEPDGLVARGEIRDYAQRHPQPDDILLVVEVAGETLKRDRELKQRLYAAAGLPEYWIVNLAERCVEVYTEPNPAASPAAYRRCTTKRGNDLLDCPGRRDDATGVPVESLFPD